MLRTLKNTVHYLEALSANLIYGFPANRLKVLAITGTDGKTTTTTLLYHILKTAGKKVALISTVAAYIGDEEIDTGFHVTNPSPFALQKLLAQVVRKDIEYVVLEITSHGIDQYRNVGIIPIIAGITNVTHEHLDYHKTYEAYLQTKARLLQKSKHAILNKDAKESFGKLLNLVKNSHVPFDVVTTQKMNRSLREVAQKRFEGQAYNIENTALASKMAELVGVDEKTIAHAVATFPGVKGRMEEIKNNKGLRIIVDFAHTPNGLEQALKAARKQTMPKASLIVIFGCAGLRDHSKRPMMGDIATRLADFAVFTAEDPRNENIWSIINQMKSGIKTGHDKVVSMPDREEAIAFALTHLAKKGDTVIICGKGHEKSMNIGGAEYPWSDQDAVRTVLSA
ncbi:UDP-N-acetylmuramoyl-L-alanyl-D-glutamate--2,6-diaminopimelate ligase [Candidatus Cerribacteria bacterium 'Amazon FNV 2010 28 9']|uniref:UDP-N-acetylmuramoyl-L-alanyl-D-glutamate--2, 6-diaminopimelate ligase n=1 Tax=Candidatus Cerribacteria bacterium 'Amazon FNV 2010 28 9' TaxID=2081795 RepID=A0A317JPL8_9BACT|nr:MAG: UDP-N-acetylmuramoyl-L-alanyl-D-glutamate--2,6-diaminopimelate ligase [Candidatus Cerribacteria bacterium 'Amazon FNV 2010 28 9']